VTQKIQKAKKAKKTLFVQLDADLYVRLVQAVSAEGTTLRAYVTAALCSFDPKAMVPEDRATPEQLYAMGERNELRIRSLQHRLSAAERFLTEAQRHYEAKLRELRQGTP
jgi:hypothetical protein